ncbi:MAG: type II toxin-antitoxin system VapC family toxin [Chloroflexota bacterium]|nr:type II toxin-antitoxin system VapC family toxin [Chloroflexota bacterium]
MTAVSRYLLDTTVLIDVSKEAQPISTQVDALLRGPDIVGVCAVNVVEFFSGLAEDERLLWRSFIDQLVYWEITAAAAFQAGILRYALARRGRQLSTQDALIAATAIDVGATLITSNVKDFDLPGLALLRLPG